MEAALLEAYCRTSFFADTPVGRLELRIGAVCPLLESLLASLGARSWAYVTSFNPHSERLSDDENRSRHRRLQHRVREFGLPAFAGEGLGDDGEWPAEPS